MKAINQRNGLAWRQVVVWSRAFIVAGYLFALAPMAHAFVGPPVGGGGTNSGPVYTPLDSWSFYDYTNWTNDKGYAPVSFTNLSRSSLGNFCSLVVDTNVPAWLQYNVFETDGTTNLTVDAGTVMFWFAPSSWSGTNVGGSGPGEFGRLLEVGGYSPDSSFGWWSVYVDDVGANLYFSAQTNDLSSTVTTYITYPIAWTTNYFHHLALTYSPTGTALYLDGGLVTNGPPMTVYPGADVLANGIFIGSDSNGVYQAHGMFDTVATYSVPMDAGTISQIYNWQLLSYEINPFNYVDSLSGATFTMFSFVSAPSSQTTFTPTNDVITGPGDLINVGSAPCLGYNTNIVWITDITATNSPGGAMTVTFGIEGGTNGVFYDVFANSQFSFGSNGVPWAWMGQGQSCQMYQLTNLPATTCFLILGTPQDSDHDGLTDAYELLVSKSNPNAYSTDGSGMADGWEVLYFGKTGITPNGDPDGDGLTTFQEWLMYPGSYNPVKWNSFSNSVVGDGYQNYSGDGLANLMQASFGGNMLTNNPAWKMNKAGDGFPDEYKAMVGLSTNSPASAPGLPSYSMNPIQ
jgi:hypothetical protein